MKYAFFIALVATLLVAALNPVTYSQSNVPQYARPIQNPSSLGDQRMFTPQSWLSRKSVFKTNNSGLFDQYHRLPFKQQDPSSERFPSLQHSKAPHLSSPQNASLETWVKTYSSYAVPVGGEAVAAVFDNAGDVYVTGASDSNGTGTNILTVKYDPIGQRQWTARYFGPRGWDRPMGIALDHQGNVYVIGSSELLSMGYLLIDEIVIVKYDAAGIQQWVAHYQDPDRQGIDLTGFGLDGAGNVLITAWHYGTISEFVTLKYSSGGILQWDARYRNTGTRWHRTIGLGVDMSNNTYVVGTSYDTAMHYSCTTIKYDPSGAQVWVRQDNDSAFSHGGPQSLAVDSQGNVYITGHSDNSSRFATVKYSSSGIRQWIARSNCPGNYNDRQMAISVDKTGNAYVAGSMVNADGFDTYAIVKYNSIGREQWIGQYGGNGLHDCRATALGVDLAGDVYVTGYCTETGFGQDFATVKYNANGIRQWVARYNNPENTDDVSQAVAVDGAGNLVVTGYSIGSDQAPAYTTLRYSPAGAALWTDLLQGQGASHKIPISLATDRSGNVYVTGASDEQDGTSIVTVKYDPAGSQQWVARHHSPGKRLEYPTAIAVDDGGNVYITGYNLDADNKGDYVTIKYNNDGIEDWVALYDFPGTAFNRATALGLDGAGNVYVTGSCSDPGGIAKFVTVKYNPAGEQQWAASCTGSGIENQPVGVKIDRSGNVYIAGMEDSTAFNVHFLTVKYDSFGIQQWAARYGSDSTGWFALGAIELDGSGDVYVNGSYSGRTINTGIVTVKYSPDGAQQWDARYEQAGNYWYHPASMVIDDAGNIYVAEFSIYNCGERIDGIILKYDPNGTRKWVSTCADIEDWSLLSTVWDLGKMIAVDISGNVYVAVTRTGNDLMHGIETIRYDSTGAQQWIGRYVGSPDQENIGVALALGGLGDVYVIGRSDLRQNSYYTTIKYTLPDHPTSIVASYGNGWNLVSLPVQTGRPWVRRNTFKYLSGYRLTDTLYDGYGYWSKFNLSDTNFVGFPIRQDIVDVTPLWNLVGSIADPLSVSDITTVPDGILDSPFFKYIGNGYARADTLYPGHGYWVKMKQQGRVILGSEVGGKAQHR